MGTLAAYFGEDGAVAGPAAERPENKSRPRIPPPSPGDDDIPY